MKKYPSMICGCIIFFFTMMKTYGVDSSFDQQGLNPYKIKNFSYLLGTCPGLPDDLLKLHFKLYEGYVNGINGLLAQIEECKKNSLDRSLMYGALKRRIGWEYDGMMLHEAYFSGLGRGKDLDVNSILYKKIVQDFGGFDAWKKDFVSTGLIRGVGWVVLYHDQKNGKLMNVWINEHDVGHLAEGSMVLVMDVWEHAYMTVYNLDRAKYIEAFCDNINWDVAEKRMKQADVRFMTIR